jgi:hypothetical protein
MTKIRYVFFMKRDNNDQEVIKQLTAEEGLEYMLANDMCNPHQIISNERKTKIRARFMSEFLASCEIYLVNTIRPARETQEIIRNVIKL